MIDHDPFDVAVCDWLVLFSLVDVVGATVATGVGVAVAVLVAVDVEAVDELAAAVVPADVVAAEVELDAAGLVVTVVELGVEAEATPLMRATVSDAPAMVTPPMANAERRSSVEDCGDALFRLGAVMAVTMRP